MTLLSDAFPHTWMAHVLEKTPLIAPARHFIYPQHIPGEEDAMASGALLVEVKPASGGTFLASGTLGFGDPSLPRGFASCPRPDHILLLAGGYAYLVDTLQPERCLLLPLRPVIHILTAPEHGLLLLGGINHVAAISAGGIVWQSERLSWEGITLDHIDGGKLHGTGWDMQSNRDLPFELDLLTGEHTGGGFTR